MKKQIDFSKLNDPTMRKFEQYKNRRKDEYTRDGELITFEMILANEEEYKIRKILEGNNPTNKRIIL